MKFYRYETGYVKTTGTEFMDTILLSADLNLIEFVMIKETPKGYWISNKWKDALHLKPIWVSKTGRKRYAYPTKEEALKSRIAINKKRIKLLKMDLEIARQILNQCQEILKNEKERIGTHFPDQTG